MNYLSKSYLKLSLLIIVLTLTSCKRSFVTYTDADRRVDDFCKSKNICLNTGMKLASQLSRKLLENVNKQKHLNLKRDPGWCGATSTAMALSGLKYNKNKDKKTRYSSYISQLPNDMNQASVYAGNLVGTNWRKGVTYTKNVKHLYDKIYSGSHAANRKSKFDLKHDNYKSYNEIRDEIKKHGMIGSILIGEYNEKSFRYPKFHCKRWHCGVKMKRYKYFVRDGGHLLAYNGYDHGLNLYDPWGRIYTVNMKKNRFAGPGSTVQKIIHTASGGKKTRTEITHKGGDRGFVKTYQSRKHLFMDELLGIAIN